MHGNIATGENISTCPTIRGQSDMVFSLLCTQDMDLNFYQRKIKLVHLPSQPPHKIKRAVSVGDEFPTLQDMLVVLHMDFIR